MSTTYNVATKSDFLIACENTSASPFHFVQMYQGKNFDKYCSGNTEANPPSWTAPFSALFALENYRIAYSIVSDVPAYTLRSWSLAYSLETGGETWRNGTISKTRLLQRQSNFQLISTDTPLDPGSGQGN
jgi:hypothetical protein